MIKNLAGTALVSTAVRGGIFDVLVACGMEKLVDDTSTSLSGMDKVFVDGDWVGFCKNSASFVAEFRRRRRKTEVPPQVSILDYTKDLNALLKTFFFLFRLR